MESHVWKKFAENEITHSAAHYLMAIDDLIRSQGYARLVDISNKLKISKGSLSTSLKSLLEKKLVIEDKNKHYSLSPKGQAFACQIHQNAQVIKQLLVLLGVSAKIAEVDACKVEHLFSPQASLSLSRLVSFLEKNPETMTSFKKNF